MFGHHEQKCLKSPVCKKCGESGSHHIELSCYNTPKCVNCKGNHPADSLDCVAWKREKEINTIKYTNNISFPEARKIVENFNTFPSKSYSKVTKQNIENKHDHSCQSCHTILEKLSSLIPDTLPQLIADLNQSLSPKSKSTSTDSSTSSTQQKHVHPKTTRPVS